MSGGVGRSDREQNAGGDRAGHGRHGLGRDSGNQPPPRRARVTYGSANATTESPIFEPALPCPPAQMTTYCLPPMENVIGVACAEAGRSPAHSSFPESTSKARSFCSLVVAATKIRPPPVTIGPPMAKPPGIAWPFGRGMEPRGTDHFFLPVARSTAINSLKGGALQGKPLGAR